MESKGMEAESRVLFSFTSSYQGCGSKVGREGGAQFITLSSDCWTRGDDQARRNIKHEILHAVGFLHEMNRFILVDMKLWIKIDFFRPDRDSHITMNTDPLYAKYDTPENMGLWVIGDGKHDQMELSKLFTNFDIMSVMQYGSDVGIKSHNTFFNEIGFGYSFNLTATDKIALNILYSCNEVKKNIYKEFLNEEVDRAYIEMGQLSINLNDKSQR